MPSTELRQNVLASARRIVVKLGTQILTHPDKPGLDRTYLKKLASQIVNLRNKGLEVTIVSSGAIGAGCAELGLNKKPKDVADQQAVAAVGQRRLMTAFHDAFKSHDIQVAQILLTRTDFDDRVRYLNIRNCISRLLKFGCIPIVNENDTVAVDELRFGENDLLAALTTNALQADALVLLTAVDGLLDADGNRVDLVQDFPAARKLTHKNKSALGTGGMNSKLDAAKTVVDSGEIAVIANGRTPNILEKLFDSQPYGTVFAPASKKLDSRRRWIGLAKRSAGHITIDDGAATALTNKGKSLLAIGVVSISGKFEEGQVIEVRNKAGHKLAKGLTNYPANELKLIMGKRSNQFEKILGRSSYAEVIHRDNLVVIG